MSIQLEINEKEIETIYSGKTGCACGCKGKYHKDSKKFSRIIKNIHKFIEEEDVAIKVQAVSNHESIIEILNEDIDKVYRIYTK